MGQVIEHADGVYLHMSEEAYFADWALGSSSIKDLHTSPPDWWWGSPFNELAPPAKDTKATNFGTAFHVAMLEGMDVFRVVYGVLPSKYDNPTALDTIDEMKTWLKLNSEKVSGSKDELIARIRANPNSAGVKILAEIQAEWLLKGKKPLSRDDFNKIHLMERVLMGTPEQPTKLGRAFTGGLSEVSVFWTDENGVRQRARFDKLKPNATIDLKTFSNWQGREFNKAMLREASIRGYPVQAAHYEEARIQLRRLVSEGKVFAPVGAEKELEVLQAIAASDRWKWCWVFHKTDGAPRAKGVIMDWKTKHAGIFQLAQQVRQEALANFIYYKNLFGLGGDLPMWNDPETIWEPEAEDFPMYAQVVD
jgi:hypothetical protein